MVTSLGEGYSPSASTEDQVVATHRQYVANTRPGCLVFHGSSDTARSPLTYGTGAGVVNAIAEADIPVVSADWGGTATWANDTSIARAGDGHTYLTGAGAGFARGQGPVFLAGFSMGAAVALNWAQRNLEDVRAVALCIPALDLEDIYTNDRGPGLAAQIATAYTNEAGWLAAEPTHNPQNFATDFVGVPVKVWYATNDPAVATSTVTAFAEQSGAVLRSLGAVGHTATAVPSGEVADFFKGYL